MLETLRVARDGGLWISLNTLTFPGVTDDEAEFQAFAGLLARVRPRMIQWRNLNIDPDAYMDAVDRAVPFRRRRAIGIAQFLRRIRRDFPAIRFGYFNPPHLPPEQHVVQEPLHDGIEIRVVGPVAANERTWTRRSIIPVPGRSGRSRLPG
ncbi:MAG: hypothetical protein QME60_08085 [Verrucomicrobiota bacterium]|nr:hypothetical protein [Verrucomicrobiota bacterium]